jgi:hypothetical protein
VAILYILWILISHQISDLQIFSLILTLVILLFFFSFSVVLGFEIRVSHLLGWQSVTSAFFALAVLDIGSHFLPRLACNSILFFYASCHCWNDRHSPPYQAFYH